jgi:hypothetical protein
MTGESIMKSDLTLVQLAQELDRQQHAKRDYLATETALEARTVADDGGTRTVVLNIADVGEHTLTPHAHGQIGTYLRIPKRYYSLMLQEAPNLLCTNLNHWLHQHEDSQRMVAPTGSRRSRSFIVGQSFRRCCRL